MTSYICAVHALGIARVECLGITPDSRRERDTDMATASKSDLLQGTLDMLILQVAALGPVHGYAIAQRLQQISKDILQVQQGSLYPALHRLEARGWLKAEWRTTETGRDAKYLQPHPAGTQTARQRTRQLGTAGAGDRTGAAHRAIAAHRKEHRTMDIARPSNVRQKTNPPGDHA